MKRVRTLLLPAVLLAIVIGLSGCTVRYSFPSSTSTIVLAHDPYMWTIGDYVEEGFTSTLFLPAVSLKIHFVTIANPGLSGGGYIPMDVLINGQKVGSFTITSTQYTIDATYAIPAGLIPGGGTFTIKYYETRTVDPGLGSVQIDTKNSYITLFDVFG